MAVFDIPSASLQPGAERHGAAVDPPDRVTAALVQLTDPAGVWNTTVGNIIRWGVQASASDGTFTNTPADWQNEGSVFQPSAEEIAAGIKLPFGSRDKSGGMPALRMSKADIAGNPLPIAQPNVKLRLAIQVDAAIVLGATVGTNADA